MSEIIPHLPIPSILMRTISTPHGHATRITPTGQETLLFKYTQLFGAGPDAWAEWNPGGNTLLGQEMGGRIRVTTLPTLAEIDAIERRNASRGLP
jgi:hypothetical protein